MKILIDIGHPAHIHYYRNFIKKMEVKGHKFIIIARNRNIIFELLKYYGIVYFSRGKGSNNFYGKIIYSLKAYIIIIIYALRYKPDFFLSQGGIYTAPIAWLLRKPNISTEDTENAIKSIRISKKFNSIFLLPSCFLKKINAKTVRYNSYQELFYLHPNYYTPDKMIYKYLNLNENQKYIIVRFVAWTAHHDKGERGIPSEIKYKLIKLLENYAVVFISSEGRLPKELENYKLNTPPEKIHDVLHFAHLFISEGATMTSESACLGTTAIYINSQQLGYCKEQEDNYGLVYNFTSHKNLFDKVYELLEENNLKEDSIKKQKRLIEEKIDPTNFLISFVENYQNNLKS